MVVAAGKGFGIGIFRTISPMITFHKIVHNRIKSPFRIFITILEIVIISAIIERIGVRGPCQREWIERCRAIRVSHRRIVVKIKRRQQLIILLQILICTELIIFQIFILNRSIFNLL